MACWLWWMLLAIAAVPGAAAGEAGAAETCPPPLTPSAPAASSPTQAAPPSRPAGQTILACVGSRPITASLFGHWANVARKAQRRLSRHSAIDEVMGFLISSDWMLGEAGNLEIRLSSEEVRHRFDHIRHEQFPKRGEFGAFLRRSGQTVADLLFRVRVNMLSALIQRCVGAGLQGAARQRALERFVIEFPARWRAQTYCAPGYAVRDCGHVQAVL